MTLRPPISSTAARPSCGRKPIAGLNFASRRVATIDWSNTRATLWRKRCSWWGSRAKDLTTRTPEMFSSASAVSSAMRCWTSWMAGRARAPVALGDDDDEGHGGDRDQPEAGVDGDHRDAGEQQRERGLQDEHEAVAEEEAHGLQVDGGARHQLAGLLAVEEAELQALQVAVDELAQVVLDAQRDAPGDHAAAGTSAASARRRSRRSRSRAPAACGGRASRCASSCSWRVAGAALDRFDGRAGEVGDQHGDDHREAREQPRGAQAALVRAKEAEQSVEGGHSCLGNDYRRRPRATAARPRRPT